MEPTIAAAATDGDGTVAAATAALVDIEATIVDTMWHSLTNASDGPTPNTESAVRMLREWDIPFEPSLRDTVLSKLAEKLRSPDFSSSLVRAHAALRAMISTSKRSRATELLPEVLEHIKGAASNAITVLAKADYLFSLSGSILPIDLREIQVPGADLRMAQLWGVDLTGADLRDCNFAGAKLSGANLSGADLTGATFAQGVPFKNWGEPYNALAVSPDGTSVAAAAGKSVQILRFSTDDGTLTPVRSLVNESGNVTCVAWSPDSKKFVAGSMDKAVRVYDIAASDEMIPEVVQMLFHKKPVTCVAWAPNENESWIVSGGKDGKAMLWDGYLQHPWFSAGLDSNQVMAVAWSPDGKRVAVAFKDAMVVHVHGIYSGHEATLRGHTDFVHGVAWSPDGRWLASCSRDNTLRLWDAQTNAGSVLHEHTKAVTCLAWSPDSRFIATGSLDRTLRVWNVEDSSSILLRGHDGEVTCVGWLGVEGWLVSGATDGTLRTWDTRHAVQNAPLPSDQVCCVAWSHDGTLIASCGLDGKVVLQDARTGLNRRVVWQMDKPPSGEPAVISSVAFSPENKSLLAIGCNDNTVRVLDVAVPDAKPKIVGQHLSNVTCVAWSPDSACIASSSWDKTVRLSKPTATSTSESIVLHGHTDFVNGVAWSPNGKLLVTAGADWRVVVWDTSDWVKSVTMLKTMVGHQGVINSVAWEPDGDFFATASDDNTVIVWKAFDGTQPTGKRGKVANMRDTPRFTVSTIHEGHTDGVTSVAWLPDTPFFVSGSKDKTVRLWNIVADADADDMYDRVLCGHTEWVTSVAVDPMEHDKFKVVSGSVDGTVRVWEWDPTNLDKHDDKRCSYTKSCEKGFHYESIWRTVWASPPTSVPELRNVTFTGATVSPLVANLLQHVSDK